MFDLIISILCSTLIFIVFKLFNRFKVNTLYAIIANYFTALTTGFLLYPPQIEYAEILQKDWLWGPIVLGVTFIVIFNLMGLTAQKVGISAASVATKMAFVIPVIIGVLFYKEQLSWLQALGILVAIAAVYLSAIKDGSIQFSKQQLLLPILVFIGSGIIDSAMKFFEEKKLAESEFSLFSTLIFSFAAISGILFGLFTNVKALFRLNGKNLIGGIILGIPNYFSIYFLLRALSNEQMASASIFTINNVGIVTLSTFVSILFFQEKMNSKNWLGISFAALSIILVALF